jgi:hypothetical protein
LILDKIGDESSELNLVKLNNIMVKLVANILTITSYPLPHKFLHKECLLFPGNIIQGGFRAPVIQNPTLYD